MSLKGSAVELLSEAAAAGPWRSAFESALVFFGHRHPTSRTLLAFCRHFGSKLIKREGEGFSRVAVFDTGGKMFCSGESWLAQMSLRYYFVGTINGQHEDEQGVARLFKRFIKKGDVFFDLGANFGFYSSYILPLCGKSGEVHSFEPNLTLIPHLRQLSDVNGSYGGIHLNVVAVGKESGKSLPFYGSDRIGCSSLYPHEWLDHDKAVAVPVVTIDEYVREKGIRRIDAMKIDIEGAELDALEGMEETLRITPPKLIVCELTLMPAGDTSTGARAEVSRAESAADPRRVASFLKERGYELWAIDGDGSLRKWEALDMTSKSELTLVNVAFIRPELKRLRPELFRDPN
jgi:FkbM family methyltransferase